MGKTHENVFHGAHCGLTWGTISDYYFSDSKGELPFYHIFHGFYSVVLK